MADSHGLVVHIHGSEVESVRSGETHARASFLEARDEGGKRQSILMGFSPIGVKQESTTSRRASLSRMGSLQLTESLRAAAVKESTKWAEPVKEEREEEEESGDEEWDPNQDSDAEEEDEVQAQMPELMEPSKLEIMLKALELCPAGGISDEQAELLRRIVEAATGLLEAVPLPMSPKKSHSNPLFNIEAHEDHEPPQAEAAPPALAAAAPPARVEQDLVVEEVEIQEVKKAPLPEVPAPPEVAPVPAPLPTGATKTLARGSLPAQSTVSTEDRKAKLKRAKTQTSFSASLDKVPVYFTQFLQAKTIPEIEEGFRNLVACAEEQAQQSGRQSSAAEPFRDMKKLPGLPWKANTVWTLLEAQTNKPEYKSKPLKGQSIVVVGAGPVGLRAALEMTLAGAAVTVLEKRDEFVRINRLHLWDWVKQDLIAWGAKTFNPPGGNFGADKDYCHIGIGELQYLLLKCCLLLGVSVELGVEFLGTKVSSKKWLVETSPSLAAPLQVDALLCCEGASSKIAAAHGFKTIAGGLGKEGKAIGIVANFQNTSTKEERDLRQFSWARQFNTKLFAELKEKVGADLENIVYYKGDENHYMIMTPTKQCLVETGCLRNSETEAGIPLLHASNVCMASLQDFAQKVAGHFKLPTAFCPRQSVMAFDFSDTKRNEQAMMFSHDKDPDAPPLPVCLAGDALLEPFWPTGLGCVRGFLSALDVISGLQIWFSTKDQEKVIRHAEATYKHLKSVDTKTKDMTLKPDHEWKLDPSTRYRGFKV